VRSRGPAARRGTRSSPRGIDASSPLSPGATPDAGANPQETSRQAAPMGMYGLRSLPPLPRVRGRLYINFDLVEIATVPAPACTPVPLSPATPGLGAWRRAGPAAPKASPPRERFRVLPQPKLWPPPQHEMRETQRLLDARARGWLESPGRPRQTPVRILALDGGGVRGVFSAALLERLCSEHPTLLQEVLPLLTRL
jgi:hypothetical protein